MRISLHLLLPWLVLSQFGTASAQDDDAHAAARALAQEGAELFEKNELGGALDKFKQAYDKFPTPKLFFNMGKALRGLRRNVEALAAFERFLGEAQDASPDFVEQASAQVAELNDKVARVVVESNRVGAALTVDGEKHGTLPMAKPLVVEAGPRACIAGTLTIAASPKDASGSSTADAASPGDSPDASVDLEIARDSTLEAGWERSPDLGPDESPDLDLDLEPEVVTDLGADHLPDSV